MRPPIDSGTVMITGASSAVGLELARQLAWRARTLVLVARRLEALVALREELHARNPTLGLVLRECDFSSPEEVDALLASLEARLVTVDVLVHTAWVEGGPGLFEDEGWGALRWMLEVNVTAPVLLAHRLVRRMVERRKGGILNVGSGAGSALLPGAAVFAGTRQFLDGFTESLRLELADAGVVVTHASTGPLAAGGRLDSAVRPPGWLRIPAEQCAREALEGFERGEPRVYPGRAWRWVVRLLALVPRCLLRGVGRVAARRLRETTSLLEPAHPDKELGRRVLLAWEPGTE